MKMYGVQTYAIKKKNSKIGFQAYTGAVPYVTVSGPLFLSKFQKPVTRFMAKRPIHHKSVRF